MIYMEHELQKSCLKYMRLQYHDVIIFSIPNGAKRSKTERAIAKSEGLTAGIPDLYIACPSKGFHGLFIELKNGKHGRVSDKQMEMMARLESFGYKCVVVRTFDEFKEVTDNYLTNYKI